MCRALWRHRGTPIPPRIMEESLFCSNENLGLHPLDNNSTLEDATVNPTFDIDKLIYVHLMTVSTRGA